MEPRLASPHFRSTNQILAFEPRTKAGDALSEEATTLAIPDEAQR